MILILVIVLSVPAAVFIGSVLSTSNVDTAVRSMQEDRLNNLLQYIDDNIDKQALANLNLNLNQGNVAKGEQELKATMYPLFRTSRQISLGMYLPDLNKTYNFEGMYNANSIQKKSDLDSITKSLKETVQKKTNKIEYLRFNNREIVRCFHPIIYNNKVVAVAFADTMIPPELHFQKSVFGYISIFGPAGLVIGLILMIMIVNNSNKNISKIGKGLEIMSKDLSYRFEPMGGDINKVAEAINIMAASLEKKEQLEEQLKRAEKLASLGQMISGVAHEIRNPLGIIRGTVQLMGKNFKEVEGLDEYIRIVKEQSDRENNVIQELLDYARPSKQIMREMDINILIKGVLSFTNKYIQDRHVRLNLELAEGLPELLMDCDKIKQVFVNMILNACEAMENGGDLKIRTEKDKDNKWLKTYFEDTGIGMNEVVLKNLFSPYYTTKPKGTGLGLAISNGIIEMHGGYIKVISKVGEGSTFVVELPINNKGGDSVG